MTIRLPTPGAEYSQAAMGELTRTLETILRQLSVSTDALPDPSKSLNNFRATSETETTITYEWAPGDGVVGVWIWDLDVAAPLAADPWASLPATPTIPLSRDVMSYTVAKPAHARYRMVMFEPRLMNLSIGRSIRLVINPTESSFTAAIKAAVVDAAATLSLTWSASIADFPLHVKIWEDAPDTGSPLAEFDIQSTASSPITSVQVPAFASRPLPLSKMKKWYGQITNVAGVDRWIGPTSADRDSIPGGEVTAANNQLRCDYDDDTTSITVTTPSGTVVYGSLSGGGTLTYTVGDAATTGAPESALGLDEVRDGYRVDYFGGGKTLIMFRGALYGPPRNYAAPGLDVTTAQLTDRFTFTYATAAPSAEKRVDSGAWTALTAPTAGTSFDEFRSTQDKVVQIRVTGANGEVSDPRTFTVPKLDSTAGVPAFDTFYLLSFDNSGDNINLNWSVRNGPSGYTVDLQWQYNGGGFTTIAGVAPSFGVYQHQKSGTGGHGLDLTGGGTTFAPMNYTLIMKDGSGREIATQNLTITVQTP